LFVSNVSVSLDTKVAAQNAGDDQTRRHLIKIKLGLDVRLGLGFAWLANYES
jgi:hypothetical protein